MEFFRSRLAKSLLPYLLLAIGVIIAWHVISEFSTVFEWLGWVWRIITPFFYGFILAYIMNMPCSLFQKLYGKIKWGFIKKIARGLAIVTSYLLLVAIIVFALWLIIPNIISSVAQFIDEMPDYYERAVDFLYTFDSLEFLGIYVNMEPDAYGFLPEGFHISTGDIEAWLQDIMQGIVQNLEFDNVFQGITTVFGGAFSVVFATVLALISSIFFLIEKDKIKELLDRILKAFSPTAAYTAIMKYSRQLDKNFKQYIKTQTIDGLILGTLATAVLAFVIRSDYALILGLMLGIINYIPYFGSIFGSLIAIVVVAFTQGIGSGALAAVTLLILQQIDGNIIQPKLMGSSFKMSPLLIIISVTIGGAIADILGMLVAIPIVAVLRDIVDNIIIHFEKKKKNKQEEVSD